MIDDQVENFGSQQELLLEKFLLFWPFVLYKQSILFMALCE